MVEVGEVEEEFDGGAAGRGDGRVKRLELSLKGRETVRGVDVSFFRLLVLVACFLFLSLLVGFVFFISISVGWLCGDLGFERFLISCYFILLDV